MQDVLPTIREAGVRLYGLSVDSPEASTRMKDELELDFALLQVQKESLRAWSLLNKKERGGIAYPAVFVLNKQGEIVFRSLDRLHSRANPDVLLQFLERWKKDPQVREENEVLQFQKPGVWDTLAAAWRKYVDKT